MAGKQPVLILQNSGLGNTLNPLTSLSLIYKLPILLLISARGYKVADEPQHQIMGAKMLDILETIGIEYKETTTNGTFEEIKKKLRYLCNKSLDSKYPVALIITKNSLKSDQIVLTDKNYQMSRYDAISIIATYINKTDAIIASTGKIAREMFVIRDLPNIFYMQGSMGHAMAIGLGLTLTKPNKRVIVLEGDGSLIMHMGTLSTIGYYAPKNLLHLILDNESYGTTGGQETTSSTMDFCQLANACGYRQTLSINTKDNLHQVLQRLQNEGVNGPTLLHVKINRKEMEHLPRITTKYTVVETAQIFKNELSRDKSGIRS